MLKCNNFRGRYFNPKPVCRKFDNLLSVENEAKFREKYFRENFALREKGVEAVTSNRAEKTCGILCSESSTLIISLPFL